MKRKRKKNDLDFFVICAEDVGCLQGKFNPQTETIQIFIIIES